MQDLSLQFRTRDGVVHALDQISLSVERGEIVANPDKGIMSRIKSAFS